MSGLINLISEHSSGLLILPILALINAAITVVIYYLNSKKIVKYLPSLAIGALALLIGIYSLATFTSPMGLNTAWIAVFLASTAIVGLCVGFIIDLIDSLKADLGDNEQDSNKSNFEFRAKRRRAKKND